jgi:hypothetical protein
MKSSFEEIAKKYDVTVDDLKSHFKNHMVRHLEPIITHESKKDGAPVIQVFIDGEDHYIPADKLIKEVNKSRMTVCVTDEEIEKGRKHTAKVKAHYQKTGDMKAFRGQIKHLIKEYPGFRPVI